MYANRIAEDIASVFSLYFEIHCFKKLAHLRLLKELDIEETKKFIAILLLIGVYKEDLEPVHQIFRKNYGRPVFNTISTRNIFLKVYT